MEEKASKTKQALPELPQPEINQPLVLVGLMGVGKTCVGRRLAKHLGVAFADADDEIVKAAGCSVDDIFKHYGETAFRDVEKRVIKRLLGENSPVIATGGGAFMDASTRELIKKTAISVWLRADLQVLTERTRRRGGRPLLDNGNRQEILEKLMTERDPQYQTADIHIDTGHDSLDATVGHILDQLDRRSRPSVTDDQHKTDEAHD